MKSPLHPIFDDLHPIFDDAPLRETFLRFVDNKAFPCVGAKSALAHGAIETITARDIRSAWDDLAIHEQLCAFSLKLTPDQPGVKSFAVLFADPTELSEIEFERSLWRRLQSIREKDDWLSYKHDPTVDADPTSPEFAFSVGGVGYFVVGMHPRSNRASRRSPMAAMIFNPFAQFQRLRDQGIYSRMSDVVKKRDVALCGHENPMLADHGAVSAARQFSGRMVSDNWLCPFAPAERS